MKSTKFNRIIIFLIMLTMSASTVIAADKFGKSFLPSLYTFQGLFGYHYSGDGLYYDIYISTSNITGSPMKGPLEGLTFDKDKLIRLQSRILDRWKDVTFENGSVVILAPEFSTRLLTPAQKKERKGLIPYVVIERKDDYITIYLFNSCFGNKLIFAIPAFENFLVNTNWAKNPKRIADILKNVGQNLLGNNAMLYYDWQFGFEFFASDIDFTPSKESDDAKKPTLFSQSEFTTPMFTIDLHAKSGVLPTGDWASAEWLAAIDKDDRLDKTKLNPNVLIENGIVTRRPFADADYTKIEKILRDAGFEISTECTLPPPTTTGQS